MENLFAWLTNRRRNNWKSDIPIQEVTSKKKIIHESFNVSHKKPRSYTSSNINTEQPLFGNNNYQEGLQKKTFKHNQTMRPQLTDRNFSDRNNYKSDMRMSEDKYRKEMISESCNASRQVRRPLFSKTKFVDEEQQSFKNSQHPEVHPEKKMSNRNQKPPQQESLPERNISGRSDYKFTRLVPVIQAVDENANACNQVQRVRDQEPQTQQPRIYPNLSNITDLVDQNFCYNQARPSVQSRTQYFNQLNSQFSQQSSSGQGNYQMISKMNQLELNDQMNRQNHMLEAPTVKTSLDEQYQAFCAKSNAKAYQIYTSSTKAGNKSNIQRVKTEKFSENNFNNFPEYNILLLGESGVGKSTTINAFANYLQFRSFKRAATAPQFVELISSKFILTDPMTGDEFPICSGNDSNEYHTSAGVSSTQWPMAYRFMYADKLVRIIDTPGMGDTRGLLVDKQNFDRILAYLKQYQQLHAIVVLIKGNEARQVASFRYCISELLSNLHASACANLVFAFTFSRNTFYNPGDGFFTLSSFLEEEFPSMKLKLCPGENCFFMDNEAFRFLVAKKCGYNFAPNQEKSYKESWKNSSAATNKMIARILNLKPHNLTETFKLKDARDLIVSLAQPLVQLQCNIQYQRDTVTQVKETFACSSQTAQDLRIIFNHLFVDELIIEMLDQPVTVCTSSRCEKMEWGDDNQNALQYSVECHQDCVEVELDTVINLDRNQLGHSLLKNCQIVSPETGTCYSCGCNWREHMYQMIRYTFKETLLLENKIVKLVRNCNIEETPQISTKIALFNALSRLERDLTSELDNMQIFNGFCNYLLEKYSNTSFGRFTEQYLDVLIAEEDAKLAHIRNYTTERRNSLEKLKESQANKNDEMKSDIESGELPDLDLKQIDHLLDYLCECQFSGPKIAQFIALIKQVKKRKIEYIERDGLYIAKSSCSVCELQFTEHYHDMVYDRPMEPIMAAKFANCFQHILEPYRQV